ncbi:MAG: galactokinase family protein [Armatimonadota bacterium]
MPNKSNQLYIDIKRLFEKTFSSSDDIKIARAPGRVNIIGEHTDYNGFPVLPTAIDREIAFAFVPNNTSIVNLINLDIRFGSRSFELSENIESYDSGDWGNYIKASAQAIWNWAKVNSPKSLPLIGFDASVGGTIPSSSGLSSSSAMVVASAFALLSANNIEIEKKELADLLAKAERYVGTEGGGMDQAASILSQSGSVLKIDFNPIRTQTFPVPDDCVFIIANSMVRANKAGKARNAYNTRVVECRLGVQMLKSLDKSNKLQNAVLLSDVMQNIDNWQELLDKIPDNSMSLSKISEFINIDKSELIEKCFTTKNGTKIELDTDSFKEVFASLSITRAPARGSQKLIESQELVMH